MRGRVGGNEASEVAEPDHYLGSCRLWYIFNLGVIGKMGIMCFDLHGDGSCVESPLWVPGGDLDDLSEDYMELV